MSASDIRHSLGEGRSELDDLAVVALYAAFEAALRAHVENQAVALTPPAGISPDFSSRFLAGIADWSSRLKMKSVRDLFQPLVGTTVASRVGQIETYRHWVAHGRTGLRPPYFHPRSVFEYRTEFLKLGGVPY